MSPNDRSDRPRFLFLEPFYGGSHRDFADGLIAHSRHRIDLVRLPARFSKWRMRGAALHFYRKVADPREYDGLVTTDLMSLADLRALWAGACPPALVYFHENQLTYPLAPGESLDVHFGFTNITTALSADRILFNSRTHFEAFFESLPGFLRMMPEYRPMWVIERIRSRCGVLPPGCRFPAEPDGPTAEEAAGAPLIIWNHRWEFDKNPGDFFAALDAVLERGLEFRLALLGENFQVKPKEFLAARERYGPRIVQYGYVPDRQAYRDWLRRGHLVVSTARQENFGIAVVEAVRHGCLPLLPDRLSYPEILPREFHGAFLYGSRDELVEKLARLLAAPTGFRDERRRLSAAMGRYAWELVIDRYDEELERLYGPGPRGPMAEGPEAYRPRAIETKVPPRQSRAKIVKASRTPRRKAS